MAHPPQGLECMLSGLLQTAELGLSSAFGLLIFGGTFKDDSLTSAERIRDYPLQAIKAASHRDIALRAYQDLSSRYNIQQLQL